MEIRGDPGNRDTDLQNPFAADCDALMPGRIRSVVSPHRSWAVAGPYLEACSCEAVCPCRSIGGRKGGRSTYGVCDFALGWTIAEGHADEIDLSGLRVVMAGSYDDDEPGSPWRVVLYVDERSNDGQRAALETIFLGRAGGTTLANFARLIGEVYAVRPARIELDHTPDRRSLRAGGWVEIVQREPFHSEEPVTCGIPGHGHPGQEVVVDLLAVSDDPLGFVVRGRCGFATTYAYSSEG
jgi:hypothetical protein